MAGASTTPPRYNPQSTDGLTLVGRAEKILRNRGLTFIGTDNFDFLLEGVPTLVANQEEANCLPNYRASSDTFDKVDIRELKLHTALAAVTVFGIAERPERLGKRQTHVEAEALMKQTGLDQQKKNLGLWPMWVQGTRGLRR